MSGGDADATVKWNLIKQFIDVDIPGLNPNICMSVGSMWPEVHVDPSTCLARNRLGAFSQNTLMVRKRLRNTDRHTDTLP